MTKVELIKAVADATGFTQKDVGTCLDAINEARAKGLATDGVVKDGMFTAKIKTSKARKGINPKTQEVIDIAPKNKITIDNTSELKRIASEIPVK